MNLTYHDMSSLEKTELSEAQGQSVDESGSPSRGQLLTQAAQFCFRCV